MHGVVQIRSVLLVTSLIVLLNQIPLAQLHSSSGSVSSGRPTSSRSGRVEHQHDQRTDEQLLELELELYLKTLDEHRCSQVLSREANVFVNRLNNELKRLMMDMTNANWNYVTNLTDENAAKYEAAQSVIDNYVADHLPTVRRYLRRSDELCNSTDVRLLKLLANYMLPPVADNPETRSRINRLVNGMEELYSTASITDADGRVSRLDPELTKIMATSRDYDRLLWAWQGWRNVTGRQMKSQHVELVEKMNEAARDNGYSDVGIAWQMTDFDETDIERMMLALFEQIKPFYRQIHAYVRRKLIAIYPNRNMDPTGPIPAHLLGNMWAQEWANIVDLVLPYPDVADVDITAALLRANYTVPRMFHTAEDFFTSLGLEPMTTDFWQKSVIVRPSDNTPMTCHGSAEDFITDTDFRIKMCTEINAEDFQTVHHEMGHIEYFMQYRHQPTIFRSGANAAFHEAVGDTIALSVSTPEHLRAIRLSSDSGTAAQSKEQELNFLMRMALNKVVFLPFALIMDKWRYEVFRGDVTPNNYNTRWWQLRHQYQGLTAPVPRSEADFDPGCKYHVPANVPYSRYFLSFIGQFQFQAALCKVKGHTGPLHKCDIYKSLEAGTKLKSVLSLGSSKPWEDAMQLMTGQRRFSSDAILEYFKPLIDWLTAQNKGHHVGW